MEDRSDAASTRGPRRLFLVPGTERSSLELMPGEMEHAVRVLRLGPGDRVTGLDGRGGTWPLAVERVARREMALIRAGEPAFEAAPGASGAALPWIECAIALPRAARAEEMVDRLTQLGVAGIAPVAWHRSPPPAQSEGEGRRERLARIARAACKQSGRAWLPLFHPMRDVRELLEARRGGEIVVLDPRSKLRLSDWIRARAHELGCADDSAVGWPWRADRPLVVVVGPEGGFEADEIAALEAAGARFASLAPHVLRVETAAEGGVAVLVGALHAVGPAERT